MRHAGSLLLSLFLAPLIWIATGYGLNEVNRARVQLSDGFQVEIVLGLLALLVAGGMYALLTMARLSPIGPALIGLVFFVLAAWAAFDPRSYFDTMPTDLRDGDLALTYPSLGYSAMLAVPLLATLLSPRRWRRHPHPAAAMPAGVPPYPMPAAGMPRARSRREVRTPCIMASPRRRGTRHRHHCPARLTWARPCPVRRSRPASAPPRRPRRSR
ncbi:hypothetical protein Pflav_062170 [Phytohabitans flavus]|uniref:Uncharacterized protein n=1 Tax=Phytohabitans flavus TaxID=1076124 RepID=A0A6F8Y173_9ACTN|nr:hypothetical protein [Phytohabitans flavus]BCB79807.1 hypothetical protein Pflav_062170 [Phytohabitans flavus]